MFCVEKVCAVYCVLNGVTVYKCRYESDCPESVWMFCAEKARPVCPEWCDKSMRV